MKAGTVPGAALHEGFPLYGTPRSLLSTFSLSSVPVGLAERAVEDFIAATRSRVSRGTRMAEVESMQLTVAEASARVEAAVAMVEATCARGYAALVAGEEVTTELVAWSKRNSAYATRLALEAVSAIFHAAGASALRRDHPLQALFCDVTAGAAHLSLSWSRNARPYGQSRLGYPLDFGELRRARDISPTAGGWRCRRPRGKRRKLRPDHVGRHRLAAGRGGEAAIGAGDDAAAIAHRRRPPRRCGWPRPRGARRNWWWNR